MKDVPSVSDMLKSKPIPIIDLFCGAGGMTLGFTSLSKGRFKSVWANDNNQLIDLSDKSRIIEIQGLAPCSSSDKRLISAKSI